MDSTDPTAAPSIPATPNTSPPPIAPPPERWRRARHVFSHWKKYTLAAIIACWGLVKLGVPTMFEHLIVSTGVDISVEVIKGYLHLHPTRWRVLAVFPDPTSSTVSIPILDALGFKNGVTKQTLIDGVDFVYVPEGRSKEDTATTLRAEIAKGDVILVVGHVTSTLAQYLDQNVYHSEEVIDDKPMPLILPAATNPQLTSTEAAGREHILRLPATDVVQIKCIRTFITRLIAGKQLTRDSTIGIIRDGSNATYSDYLGDEIVAQADTVDQSVGANLGGVDIPMPTILDHDVVVVAGMERLSKVLLRRMYRRDILIGDSPEFLFTDGVAGEVFYKATAVVLQDRIVKNKNPKAPEPSIQLSNQHVWMSGPFQPRDRGGALYKKGDLLPDKPDYYSYGELD